jgi:hypothetical protein
MKDEQSLTEFWAIVQACLVELYGMTNEVAAKAVQRLWTRRPKGIRSMPSLRSMVYHAAPIHIAMDLAGEEIASPGLWERYAELLKRYGALQPAKVSWVAESNQGRAANASSGTPRSGAGLRRTLTANPQIRFR